MILFNLCGHGHFDLAAYEKYLDGTLEDYEYPAEGSRRRSRACRRSRRTEGKGAGRLGGERDGPLTGHLPEWPVGRRKRRTSADDVGRRRDAGLIQST